MSTTLYDLRVCRSVNGKTMPAKGDPDTQVEAVVRDVRTHLLQRRAAPAVGGGAGTAPAPATGITPDSLAQFLQANWPGASTAVVDEYYWYITPTGNRVLVCIEGLVAVTQEQTSLGQLKPVDPPITVSFELQMA